MPTLIASPVVSLAPSRPLVSCICVTRNRRAWLPTAIRCFLRQTYRPIELVVVNDADVGTQPIADIVLREYQTVERERGFGNVPSIQYWNGFYRQSYFVTRGSIGAKRNAACALANGELICHWDDDDWSAPTRIEHQVSLLLSTPPQPPNSPHARPPVITGFRNMLFTDGQSYHVYTGTPGFMLGTSFLYRKSWWADHPFEDRNTCEDSMFKDQIPRQLCVVDEECPTTRMYATMHTGHDGNTSARTITTYSWQADVEKPEWAERHPAFDKTEERAI